MRIQDHLERASAFDRALEKLDKVADGELYSVFLMRAATNRLNAALHALDVTGEGAATSTKLGDLNHTYKPPMPGPVPASLRETFAHLAFIENLRPQYVRGPLSMDARTAEQAMAGYERIRRETDAVLSGKV